MSAQSAAPALHHRVHGYTTPESELLAAIKLNIEKEGRALGDAKSNKNAITPHLLHDADVSGTERAAGEKKWE